MANLSSTEIPDDLPEAGPSTSRLTQEAKRTLSDAEPFVNRNEDRPEDDGDDADEEGVFETEEEIIERAMAEAALEQRDEKQQDEVGKQKDPALTTSTNLATQKKDDEPPDTDNPGFPPLFLPALPTHDPIFKDEDEDGGVDDDLQKRMNLLLGLSGPTLKPGQPTQPVLPSAPKRQVGQGWNLPGYNDHRDDDLDTWCCELTVQLHTVMYRLAVFELTRQVYVTKTRILSV